MRGGGDDEVCGHVALVIKIVRQNAHDGGPEHGLCQTVDRPDGNDPFATRHEGQDAVANGGGTKAYRKQMRGLDSVAEKAAEQLSCAVEDEHGGLYKPRRGGCDRSRLKDAEEGGGKAFSRKIAGEVDNGAKCDDATLGIRGFGHDSDSVY